MSFLAPLWLFALLLVPAIALVARASRRRARRYALRHPAVDSLAAAAQAGRSRALALLAPALLALALAALIVGLARPRLATRTAIQDAQIVLVLDHSGSMAATDVRPSRISAAIAAGDTLIDELPSGVRVGFVAFGSTPTLAQAPVLNHGVVKQQLAEQFADGGTDTGPALQLALSLLHAGNRRHPPSAIVLLSDGAANLGVSPVSVAAQARADHVAIDTIALGTAAGVLNLGPFTQPEPVPPDPALMRQIAATSGGRSFDAQTENELSSIYTALGRHLGSRRSEADITVEVLLAAVLLGVIGGAVAIRGAGVLP